MKVSVKHVDSKVAASVGGDWKYEMFLDRSNQGKDKCL
jgi:hypothetical protein